MGAGVKVTGFSWVGISTRDFQASMRFFRDVLGLETWVEGEDQAILKTESGQQLELFGEGRNLLATHPVIAFEVDDLESACEELRRAGVELIGDIGRWNGFSWQYFRSPDDHIFEIKSAER
jgi:catechol 2,3-dioxygenase-like lactoylglutathione lyase family enzyme